MLNDYCDGEAFKSHGIFGSYSKALQFSDATIIIYRDIKCGDTIQ